MVSFVALAVAWPRPRLQRPSWRPLPRALDAALSSRALERICGVIGVALLGITVWAGLAGTGIPAANFTPTFVYVAFWLGLVPLSALLGDVFRPFNPWRALARAGGAVRRPGFAATPRPYPGWLGYWPAAAGLLAFGWLELVSPQGDEPFAIAVAALVYTAVTLVAMSLFGAEPWTARGEAFSVYFNLVSRLSVFERREGRLGLRPPLAGLPSWPSAAGAVGLLATMVGIVSYDGLSAGRPFDDALRASPLRDDWLHSELGFGTSPMLQAVFIATMVVMAALAAGFYWLGIRAVRALERRESTHQLGRSFAHTLAPIAVAYVAAHYLSLLVFEGQAMAFLVSDPLGQDWDLFGTADLSIDYELVEAETIWYLQVGSVVIGHVAALALAHDRALAVFDDVRAAIRSQYMLLGVMVGFTTFALWLLAQARPL